MKTFNLLTVVAIAAISFWMAGTFTAAQPPAGAGSIKIGYVDFQKILDESVVGKKAQQELEKKFGATKEMIKKKGEELQNLQNEIEKQKDVLSPLALEEKKNLFAVKYKSYMQQKMMLQEQYNAEFIKHVKPMLEEISKIIKSVGKEKGYTMIFKYDVSSHTEESKLVEYLLFPTAIVYFDGGVDLTPEVLKRYDAKHP